jgi:lipopolysaccharide biosynthesis glycosyltransferase
MDTIHIASASNELYFPGLLGTLTSLLISSHPQRAFSFHIIDEGINDESWKRLGGILKRINSNVELLRLKPDLSSFHHFPKFFYESSLPYARLLLPALVSSSKVIYVDADMIFLKNIELLWEIDLQGNPAAACLDIKIKVIENDCPIINKLKIDGNEPYFNSGLLIMDLEKFREQGIIHQTIRYINDYPEYCKYWDQSALNISLYKKFLLLDQSWNYQAHKENEFAARLDLTMLQSMNVNYHFISPSKPWLHYHESPPFLIYYKLIDNINYKLSNPQFIRSRNNYYRKTKLIHFLPFLYYWRWRLKSLYNKKRSTMDYKIFIYWKQYVADRNYYKSISSEIEELINKWSEIIHNRVNNYNE